MLLCCFLVCCSNTFYITYHRCRASKEEAILVLQILVICFQKGLLIHMRTIPMHLISGIYNLILTYCNPNFISFEMWCFLLLKAKRKVPKPFQSFLTLSWWCSVFTNVKIEIDSMLLLTNNRSLEFYNLLSQTLSHSLCQEINTLNSLLLRFNHFCSLSFTHSISPKPRMILDLWWQYICRNMYSLCLMSSSNHMMDWWLMNKKFFNKLVF